MGAIGDVNVNEVAQAATSSAQEQGQSTQIGSGEAPSTQNTPSGDGPLNLDTVLKFKFGDREWTPDQLKKSVLMHSDYTKKTTALAQTQKYWDNLDADLSSVRSKPELAEAFLQTYPKEFHKYLKAMGIESTQSQSGEGQAQGQPQIDPELMSRLSNIENYVNEQQVKSYEAQIDAKFSTLSKKYPEGNEDVVLARAQAILDKGGFVTDETWEKLWKSSHDHYLQRFESRQKTTLTNQRTANQSAKGPASGGGTPTYAPPTKMSMKEATEYAVRNLTGKG